MLSKEKKMMLGNFGMLDTANQVPKGASDASEEAP
jgi:hypothetical protein